MSATEKIDDAISHAETAKRAALEFDSHTAAMEFKNAALILKDVIYSGKITDTKSLHFLREQHDKFSRLHRLHKEKVTEKAQEKLEKRMQGLRNAEKKGDSEEGLRKRFAALKGPKVEAQTEEQLHKRFAALTEGAGSGGGSGNTMSASQGPTEEEEFQALLKQLDMVDENGKLKQTTTSTQQQAQQATLTQEEIQGQAELTQAEIAAYNTIRQYEEQVHGFVMAPLNDVSEDDVRQTIEEAKIMAKFEQSRRQQRAISLQSSSLSDEQRRKDSDSDESDESSDESDYDSDETTDSDSSRRRRRRKKKKKKKKKRH